jgi:hypothetical protein
LTHGIMFMGKDIDKSFMLLSKVNSTSTNEG